MSAVRLERSIELEIAETLHREMSPFTKRWLKETRFEDIDLHKRGLGRVICHRWPVTETQAHHATLTLWRLLQ
ncbi:gp51 [Alphaproteobacteria phage PhiJL001]|uniref:Gp51 n=1 Tax=Alphaproteobacteria phage PhiJL001 TaxID=2681607 RepID=Q5DN54_9CAUD|nr:gp51 [Alphaproteobacteria phage PhiJL001]AAT69527.1 gp51 [Alphaproteobacteria phage PhiJL001]